MSHTLTVAVRHKPSGTQYLESQRCAPEDTPDAAGIEQMRSVTQEEPEGNDYLVLIGIPGGKQ